MNSSFVEFMNKYLTDPIKLYDYQKNILNNIENINKPINFYELRLKQRQYNRRLERMFRLYSELLHNNNVLDLYLALHFKFELNDNGELELVIDEYSQSNNSQIFTCSVSLGKHNIIECKLEHDHEQEKKSYTEMLRETLTVIKGITLDVSD